MLQQDNLEEIMRMREKAIDMRIRTETSMMEKLVREKSVSPQTYKNRQLELEKWILAEREDMSRTKKEYEKGWLKAIDSL